MKFIATPPPMEVEGVLVEEDQWPLEVGQEREGHVSTTKIAMHCHTKIHNV